MNPASWTKTGYPLLTSDDVPGQAGPGHNSFTVDEYGNPVIVYHSRTIGDTSNTGEASDGGLYDPRRHTRANLLTWDVDGAPVLNQTQQERLADAQSRVQVRVVVAVPQITATVDPAAPTGAEFSGEAALDPANWTSLGGVKAAAGDAIAFRNFSLDMTHFESGGRHYVVWAENPGPSTLRMAEIDPSNPSQLASPSIQL